MSSYFELELDTTAPNIEIAVPSYTFIGLDTEIFILSDEKLMEFQDIYFIDSDGVRHDVTFLLMDGKKEFYGKVNFNDYPIGVTGIYVRVRDEVGNYSDLTFTYFNILEEMELGIKISVKANKVDVISDEKLVLLGKKENNVDIGERVKKVILGVEDIGK